VGSPKFVWAGERHINVIIFTAKIANNLNSKIVDDLYPELAHKAKKFVNELHNTCLLLLLFKVT
jgi:hypothetical protein